MAMVKGGKSAATTTRLLSLAAYLLCVPVPHVTSLISFDYNFSTPGVLTSADINYTSNATASGSGDRIDLTVDKVWSTGRVAYGQPVQLWDDSTGKVASFTSNFTFAIWPHNSTSQGDGMAFFVGPFPPSLPQDSNGGFLGLVNNPDNTANTHFPPAVGVEFDAFRNNWDPNDTVNHVGVDVNSIVSRAYAALPDGCFNGTMSAWVRYDADSRALSATLRFDHPPGLQLYNVSTLVDFKEAGLPREAAVGFSAATGEFIERHQLLSWSFESTLTSVAVGNKTGNKGTSKVGNIGLIAGVASTGIFIPLVVAAWLCYRQHLKRKGQATKRMQGEATNTPSPIIDGDMDDEFAKGAGPRRFTYSQLSAATRGFSDDEKLGEGGFGPVYRGFLHHQGLHVAIKRVSKTSKQGRREYVSEVTIIGRLRHRNLVQLIGWCHEADELLLVYELMTNGSLHDHLYSTGNTLTWPVRYNIILGIGSAVVYLHQEWEQCVVHRDIKPSNVMLDSSFNAKLGDFGLARLIDHSRAAHTTMLAGTKGYMDPECVVTCRASAHSDVYSFGVVLLETACGRKPVVPEEDEGRVLLVHWVWDLYGRGQILDAADARLRLHTSESDVLEMERALVVGLWCVNPDHAARPTMRQAMNVLQFEAPLPELPLEMPLATYGAPAGGYCSGYTTSSSGGASNTRGRSSASDRTAHSSAGSSAARGSACGSTTPNPKRASIRSSDDDDTTLRTIEQFQSTHS